MNAMFIPSFYGQTEPFTCGAAGLIMALQSLGKLPETPSRQMELEFWRQANTIYMGEDHPGCGPYGLGLIALRHNCRAILFTTKDRDYFSAWNAATGKGEAARLIEDHDREMFLSHGGKIKPYENFEKNRGALPHACLALTGDNVVKDAHWICLIPSREGRYILLDPEMKDGVPVRGKLTIANKDVERHTHYMGERTALHLSL